MSATTRESLRCVALRKDGQPCHAFASTPDGRCVMHSERAAEIHAKGGAATSNVNRATKLLPARMRPLVERLEQTFTDLAEGRMDERTRVALAMVAVAGMIIKAFQASELEESIRALERQVRENERYMPSWQRGSRWHD